MSDRMTPLLTIAIPTFNRDEKLRRTLACILAQIESSAKLKSAVELLVSDNCSSDTTPAVLDGFQSIAACYRHMRQPYNLGFDGNLRALYMAAEGKYVWFFSDDDILFEGSIERVLSALTDHGPDALLFSFLQPPDSTERTFGYPSDPALFTDPREIILMLTQYPKVSIYVLKKVPLSAEDVQCIFEVEGWSFVSLALTVISKSEGPALCVISQPLAGSDYDFQKVRVAPAIWGQRVRVFDHPYARRHVPDLLRAQTVQSYFEGIGILWAWRAGTILVEPELESAYWRELRRFQMRWGLLATNRGLLLRAAILKSWPHRLPRFLNRLSTTLRGQATP